MLSKPSSSVGQNVRLINGRPQVQSLSRLVTAQLCMPRNKMPMLFKSSSSVGQNIRLINGRPQVQSLSRLVEHCRQCNFFLLLCVMMSYLQSPTTYAYVQQRDVFIFHSEGRFACLVLLIGSSRSCMKLLICMKSLHTDLEATSMLHI